MSKYLKIFISIIFLSVIIYYLWKVVLYIIIASLITLLLSPLNDKLSKVKIFKRNLSNALRASIILIFFWFIIFGIGYFILPNFFNEFYKLSEIKAENISNEIFPFFESLNKSLIKLDIIKETENIKEIFAKSLVKVLNLGNLGKIFSDFFIFLKDFLIGFFIISIITFFFLRDKKLIIKLILIFVPDKYHQITKLTLLNIYASLLKYFSMLLLDIIIVAFLVFIGMLIVGNKIQTAILLGVTGGFLNIIPYVGPISSFIFGLTVNFVNNLHLEFYELLTNKLLFVCIIYLTINLIDVSIVQPYIYSKILKSHPLEIFLIIIIGGTIGGLLGMMIAIPSYIILKIIIKNFFSHYYIAKNIEKGIN